MSGAFDLDDLFADADATVINLSDNVRINAHNDASMDAQLQIPEGYTLAYNPGDVNKLRVTVLGSSAKSNADGPTSIKVACSVSNATGAGKDIIREGPGTVISMCKNEKVTTTAAVQVNAKLIHTGVTPTLLKATNIVSLTLTLGKITHKGLKEAAVQSIVPGAELELSDVYYNTSGMGVPWLTCNSFNVVKKTPLEEPRNGVAAAIQKVRDNGESLLFGVALNAVGFRSEAAPQAQMDASFKAVKSIIQKTKDGLACKLNELYPGTYVTPPDPLKLEDSDLQVPPVLLFSKTKVASPQNESKGVLFNDAKLALFYNCKEQSKLSELFSGGAIVASEITGRSYADSKLSGQVHVIETKQVYVPSVGLLSTAGLGPKNLLTLPGPTLKVPLSLLAAPFGVNERNTAELLMTNVIPYTNMAFFPAKSKIYSRNYDDSNYSQDIYIESQSQVTIDVLSTFRNVGLRVSRDTVVQLYGGASHSVAVPTSGESLVDMIGTDHKPIVSTLALGGVVSLRENAVYLKDDTLEFYAVVPNAINIAQDSGNINCGTNELVGNKAFLQASGGTIEGCSVMLKKGELGVFAVRVAAKKLVTSKEMSTATATEDNAQGASKGFEEESDEDKRSNGLEEDDEDDEETPPPPPKKKKKVTAKQK